MNPLMIQIDPRLFSGFYLFLKRANMPLHQMFGLRLRETETLCQIAWLLQTENREKLGRDRLLKHLSHGNLSARRTQEKIVMRLVNSGVLKQQPGHKNGTCFALTELGKTALSHYNEVFLGLLSQAQKELEKAPPLSGKARNKPLAKGVGRKNTKVDFEEEHVLTEFHLRPLPG